VAYRFLAQGNQIDDIYPALKIVALRAESLPIPEPLLQLADIRPPQLFVTTTFDSFLARAINLRRYSGNPKTQVLAYSPNQVEDMSADLRSVRLPIVYQLFGKLSASPAYAVTQEDTVEFFHSLQSEARQPRILFHELNRKSMVILGSRFSGWLARLFFIRMSRPQRLSAGGKSDYLADAKVSGDPSLVMFLKHFSKPTKVFHSGDALDFVSELHRRWMERHADGAVEMMRQSLLIRQLALSGNGRRLNKLLPQNTSIRFGAQATDLRYRDQHNREVYNFALYPEERTLPAGPDAVAFITYLADHPTFQDTLMTAGPDRQFRVAYIGWGCLVRITALVEYRDPAKSPTAAEFNMCEKLGWP